MRFGFLDIKVMSARNLFELWWEAEGHCLYRGAAADRKDLGHVQQREALNDPLARAPPGHQE